MSKLAIVTGANRGLGKATSLELANRGYQVIMMGRDEKKIHRAADEVNNNKTDGEAIAFVADVQNMQQILDLKKFVESQWKALDVLVNNAGVFNGTTPVTNDPTVANTEVKTIEETFSVNTLGPFRMIKTFWDLLQKSPNACVVNVSSGMGQLSEMEGGYIAYRMSKSALNTLTRVCAKEFPGHNVKINSVCPGWVKTDMGGANATREIDHGISGIVWAATLDTNGPTGQFFRDGSPIAW
ncbi:MAG: SDR family NAD(P)-dependent oxidoreductase [Halobacteriovoraceae bacterium]|nr:SDR family NAD(P)-dependent oxidoreductase [Halobacteriovoraceae bacterium]MCB9095389.1 SDR family NAD(P)-dependent oxidoreductase [Halobacteriovoraceae bacterium]